MTNYSFGGIPLFSAIVLAASYFATSDSLLYGEIEAGENLLRLSHRTWVCIWTIAGAAMALFLSLSGASKSMESITSLNAILMPIPTVIMMVEWFLIACVFRTGSISSWRVPKFSELPTWRWPATVALVFGITVGIATSGIIPGTSSWAIGICSVQAWLTSLIIYVPLRLIEYRLNIASKRVTLKEKSSKSPEPADIA